MFNPCFRLLPIAVLIVACMNVEPYHRRETFYYQLFPSNIKEEAIQKDKCHKTRKITPFQFWEESVPDDYGNEKYVCVQPVLFGFRSLCPIKSSVYLAPRPGSPTGNRATVKQPTRFIIIMHARVTWCSADICFASLVLGQRSDHPWMCEQWLCHRAFLPALVPVFSLALFSARTRAPFSEGNSRP